MTSAKLGKIAGWLLIVGPLVDTLANLLRPGSIPTEHPEGAQATLQEVVRDSLDSTGLVHVLIDIEFAATFGLLLGFWGVSRIMGDAGGRGHLRKMGMLLFGVAVAVRTVGAGMGYLMASVVAYVPPEALAGPALETAVQFAVMEGAMGIFATMLIVVGIALFAISMVGTGLLGRDRMLATLLAVIPAVLSVAFLILAPLFEDSIFTLYLAGNLIGLIPVAYMVVLGVALLRKGDALPAMS